MKMSRNRPDLVCFVYTFITLAFGSLSANAQPAEYEFTALVTAPGVAINSFNSSTSVPTINNSGVVAYTIRSAPFFWDLVVTDGSSTTTINLNAAAGIGTVNSTSRPFINDSGAVAVSVNPLINNVCLTSSLLRIDPDSTVTVLATANCDGVSGDFRSIDHFLAMNNLGQVAAEVSLNSPQVTAIAIIDDGGFSIVDTVTANRFNFNGSAINDAGVVAYKAGEPAPNFVSVFTGDGMSPVQQALPLPLVCGNIGAEPDINNNGLIAGQHPLCLVVGSGGVVTEVIVDEATNPFATSIGRLSLNDLDQIVFNASTSNSNGASGLYFGDDPVNDKLIDVGDSLFGEIVGNPTGIPFCCGQAVRFGGDGGFNDQGQVVFLASTVSESNVVTSYLIRADLKDTPDSDGDGVLDADDLCPGTAPDAEVDEFGCSAAQLDTDEDSVSDAVDLCPETAPGADVDAFGCSDLQVDADSDGVCDPNAASIGPAECVGSDVCADTMIPEAVPTSSRGLGRNRWTLDNPDGSFTQGPPQAGSMFSFTTDDTRGCSCEQIIAEVGLGKGHTKYGCSNSAIMDWVNNP